MAEQSRFFNSIDGDRIYSAPEFSTVLEQFVSNGYVVGLDDELEVTQDTGNNMKVLVGLGYAWVEGHWYNLYNNKEQLTIPTADSTDPRIDRIVVRLDKSNAERRVFVTVKQGTPSSSPQPPSLQRDSTIYELSLAQVRVNANQTTIQNSDITDERNTEDFCGQVVDPQTEYKLSADISSAGWYRIAVNGNPERGSGGNRAQAMFTLRDDETGNHSSATFFASVHYNNNPTIALVCRSFFASNGAIEKIRLITGTSDNGGSALEVYIDGTGGSTPWSVNFSIFDNLHRSGWMPIMFEPGNVPSGYNTTELDLTKDPVMGIAANQNNDAFYVKRDGSVFSKGEELGGGAIPITGNPGSAGWYRIAINGSVSDGGTGGTSATGHFAVRDKTNNETIRFTASVGNGAKPQLTLLNHSYTGSKNITGVRLVEGDAGEGAAVEVQLAAGSSMEYLLSDHAGWTEAAWTAGSIPTGFTSTVINLSGSGTSDKAFAIATDGQQDAPFYVSRSGLLSDKMIGCKLNRTTDQAISGGTTSVLWTAAEYDTDNFWSSSAQDQIFFRTGGLYLITAQISLTPMSAGTFWTISFLKNGSTIIAQERKNQVDNTSFSQHGVLTTQHNFSPNDYIIVQVEQNDGSESLKAYTDYAPRFYARRIGNNFIA